ncbi:AcrR family transcriptional regulator [Curtobacterium pusillum]|uniref:AcrR family transcriptional regulator n=1 Tax=Curtobacterium pusillum TaxID=69373 RepID=A0AAW3T9K6_9MICO|nr:AcrR family transcriptional regulator [Curtobacterium pusillum]
MTDLLDARQLAAAARCADAVLAAGTTALGVEELREAAGVSRRTFHRWFPSKARWIHPVYAAVTEAFMTSLRSRGVPSVDSVVAAWSESVYGPDTERSLGLYRLIRADPEYWAVFLEVLEVSEARIAAVIRSLSTDHDERAARVAAVAVVSSSRLALERAVTSGADAIEEFRAFLEEFGAWGRGGRRPSASSPAS